MTLTVYSVSGAPRPWRVLLGLTFKGLAFDIRLLKAARGEHRSEAYLRINPRGTVPSLVGDGPTLRDSIAILAWLDRAYPDRPLFGRDVDEAARVWQVSMEACDYLRGATDALLRPIFFEGATAPTPHLIAAGDKVREEFAWLEGDLEDRFLCGATPSAADAICYPEIRLVQRAAETHRELMTALGFPNALEGFPRLSAWCSEVEAVDGFAQTLPPHWSDAHAA